MSHKISYYPVSETADISVYSIGYVIKMTAVNGFFYTHIKGLLCSFHKILYSLRGVSYDMRPCGIRMISFIYKAAIKAYHIAFL